MYPNLCNAGSIHDIPIGKGRRLNLGPDHFAIFRETFGHFYVFADDVPGEPLAVSTGVIHGDKIELSDGHVVDLHTGRFDDSNYTLRSFNAWVENGFILFTLSQVATSLS